MTVQTESNPRWLAVVARDAAAAGTFVYAVTTTGVYCRPTCAARLAKPENVQFFDTCEEAEQAGFRACKRCTPSNPVAASDHAASIVDVCRWLQQADEVPRLQEMARRAGLSAYHFHRLFKAATGMTPRAYAVACRDDRARERLRQSGRVTDAIYDAGYNSNGRFYARADQALGMTPSSFRQGGTNTLIRFAVGECSLGSIAVAQSERGICAISLGNEPETLVRELQDQFPRAELVGGDAEFEQLIAQVVAFVESPNIGFHLPLDVRGTVFQRRVWQALQEIPPGSTATYSDIASRIGAPAAVRAVGRACGANALAVAIPCHRVVRNDGALSGYRWGVDRKRTLLQRERQQ